MNRQGIEKCAPKEIFCQQRGLDHSSIKGMVEQGLADQSYSEELWFLTHSTWHEMNGFKGALYHATHQQSLPITPRNTKFMCYHGMETVQTLNELQQLRKIETSTKELLLLE